MDGTAVVSVPIREQTQVAEARRKAVQLASPAGLGEQECARLALVVTEAATNILRHGGGGEILLDARSSGTSGEVTVIALDSGPGMANVQDCLRDGVTSGDSPGTGLGAIRRQSDHFDIYSKPGNGTAIVCGVRAGGCRPAPDLPGLEVGAVCLPRIGEAVSGDTWSVRVTDRGATLLLLCDGLGHGLGAADAADAARAGFRQSKERMPEPLVEDLHRALRGTRGAAVAVVRIEPVERRLRFAGVGNIAGFFRWRDGQTRTVSQNGVVGHNMSKVKEYEYAYGGDLLAVFHSDGLSTKWDIDSYPGLATRHPTMIAAVLYRDFKRVRDDNLIVVVKTRDPLTWPLFTVHVRHDRDIVHARQRARLVADRMGFEVQDQTRIATAVSEVCRNAYAYANGGKADFRIQEIAGKVALVIEVGDRGPGIAELDDILAGRYRSRTGMGLGLLGARRLMDRLDIETSGDGTTVRLTRILSKPLGMAVPEFINKLMDELARQQPLDPVEEVQRQNQELLSSLNDLRQREEELLEANAALRASVVEKEVLLKEVYHRVKNNLQIISSLVSLKARKSTNPLVRQELDDVRSRIHSLSIVHEKLYQSDDLARVDLSGYVRDLCAHLRTSFTARGDGPELMVETENVALGLDMAIQLGLLINEIVTNAFKHAFPDGARGEIRVSLTVLPEERLRLEVTDNGKGMPEEATDSLGMNLIRALATRVEGVLEIEGSNGHGGTGGGTRVTVTMPLHGD